jgi:D-aspartate ligase
MLRLLSVRGGGVARIGDPSARALVSSTTPTPTRPPVPAVVVEGTLNALGVVRSLSRGRMPIYLLDNRATCPANWSRFCRYVRVPALEGRPLVDALAELGRRLGCRPVLILTGDQSVNTVSEYRELLEPLYRISLPSAEIVQALADKTEFQKLAEREGFIVPRAQVVDITTDLARLDTLTPPLIIKPADKTLVLNRRVERAVRAATLAEARKAAVSMLTSAPRIIVQEWVEGPDTEIYFTLFACDRDGRAVGMFVGRKVVCDPPAIGSTAVCVAAPEVADELIAPTMHFIGRVGYRGLGSLEFKRDVRSGRFFIIEPTVGRTDWQEELATLCGVNLPLRAYLTELGEPLEPAPEAFPSVAWRQSAGYRARLAPGMRAVDGFFRWSDPLPGLYYYICEGGLLRVWSKFSAAASALTGGASSRAKG